MNHSPELLCYTPHLIRLIVPENLPTPNEVELSLLAIYTLLIKNDNKKEECFTH